ncbi:MAG: MFS transporter [Actinomycetia bacterium]|nr:MFS transporter [Actinomycetes bacterium]
MTDRPTGRGVVVLATVAGAFGSLDSALNVAFPDLSDHFGLDVSGLQWVVVTFVLAFGGSLVVAGQLADRHGHRRVLGMGGAASVVAMAICATAPTFGVFLGARVLQGLASALVMAAAPALITNSVTEDHRTRALAQFQTSAAVGLAIGPVIGGPLVEALTWRGVFWFRVPVAAVLVLLAVRARSPAQEGPARTSSDVLGGLTVTAILAGGLVVVNGGRALGWTSPPVIVAGVIAAAGLAIWPRIEARVEVPVLPPRLFRSVELSAALGWSIVANGAMFATWLLVPSLLVDQLNVGVLATGLVLAASPVATALVAPGAGWLADRGRGGVAVVAGLGLEAVGMALLSLAGPAWGAPTVAGGLALVGVGLGLFVVPNMATVMSALPRSAQGVAGGLALLTRTTGIVISVGVASTLFDRLEPDQGFFAAFELVYRVAAAVLLLAAVAEGVRRLAAWVTPAGQV